MRRSLPESAKAARKRRSAQMLRSASLQAMRAVSCLIVRENVPARTLKYQRISSRQQSLHYMLQVSSWNMRPFFMIQKEFLEPDALPQDISYCWRVDVPAETDYVSVFSL